MSPTPYLRATKELAPRIGSFTGLVGLLIGIPAILILFHATPPFADVGHFIASPGAAVHHLDRSLDDTALANSVISAAWIAWLWLVICIAVETRASIRGRPPLNLPASRHVQSLAAALVGASLTVLPLGRAGLPMRFHGVSAPIHATVGDSRQGESGPQALGTERPAPDDARTEIPPRVSQIMVDESSSVANNSTFYAVKPGDTLWSIAENELGSPLQWRQIADLNYGRRQPDGGFLKDAHWIYPGWQLLLPGTPIQRSSDMVERLSGSPVTPLRSDAVRPELSTPRSPDARSVNNGDHSGASIDYGSLRSAPPRTHRSETERNIPSPVSMRVVGYGVFGAGVITLLERLRRVQRRRRPRGMRIALPDADLAELERRLRAEADPEAVDAIDLGLRALVVNSLRRETMPPQVTMVRLTGQALEIVLDPNSNGEEAPQPFSSDASASHWFLSRDQTTLQELREDPGVAQMDAPFPSLVTIGRDDLGLVMVDLEQAASLDIRGANKDGILGRIAIEVATAKWADQVDVVLVGFDGELESLERVIHVPAIADIVPKIHRRVRERKALLASVGRSANWEIRWTEGGDAWDLYLVICASRAVEADLDGAATLVRLAGNGGSGLAVVLGSDVRRTRWHLDSVEGRIELEGDGALASVLPPESDDSRFSTGVASLVRIAGRVDGVRPTEPPYDKLVDERPIGEPETTEKPDGAPSIRTVDVNIDGSLPSRSVDPEVLVRVLGPVEIVGAARPFTRAWAVELIVYLAMHRNGASSEQWATALWPDRIMASASLHSTASAARRSLGVSREGEDHLPRAHGRLSLAPTVRSDWNKFVALSEREEPASWREALELIRGRPFEGLRAPDWVLLEGIAANVEAVVVDLASRYAEFCLSAHDPTAAEWSARQGLRVSAYDERLYRILLRAADAAGNPAGVESVMAELVRLVAEDVEPFDAVHPETLDLYRMLSRRPAPTVIR